MKNYFKSTHVGRALELDQNVKLSRSQVVLFKLCSESPCKFRAHTDQIHPSPNFSNLLLAHWFLLCQDS